MSSEGGLFGPLFGDAEVAGHLSDRARLQAMLDVEAALADAEAQLGVVPQVVRLADPKRGTRGSVRPGDDRR